MPDYKDNTSVGRCGDARRGAPMGRLSVHPADPKTFAGRVHVSRVRLDAGGYDSNGTYWGHDLPLWWVACDDEVDLVVGGPSRAYAKAYVRDLLPQVRFYR